MLTSLAMADCLIVIPARLKATRLPDKPLADIHGEPMIVHVWRRAMEADSGPVLVAAAEAEIAEAVRAAGGKAVLTRPDHPPAPTASPRRSQPFDPERRYDAVVNSRAICRPSTRHLMRAAWPLADPGADIGTMAAPITREEERDHPNVVKAVGAPSRTGRTAGRARSISPAPPPRRAKGRTTTISASMPIAARAGALRRPAASAAGAAREAGAAARARGRHAHRRRPR